MSKRLALLRRPEPPVEALAAGKITAADGAELGRLAGHPDRAVKALEEIGDTAWATAEGVVARHLAQIQVDRQAAEARAAMEAEGITVIEAGDLGPRAWAPRLAEDADLSAHREAGCLTRVARGGYRDLYCANPAAHEGTPAGLPGQPPPEVAAWAGHSVAVLMSTYARCMTGMEVMRIIRMSDGLRLQDPASGDRHGNEFPRD